MVFYSPKEVYGRTAPCQRFTALAEVGGESYQVMFSDGLRPFRKPARYFGGTEVPVQPLLDSLGFIPDRAR